MRPNPMNSIAVRVILLSSLSISMVYLMANVFVQKNEDFFLALQNFLLIFLYMLFLWGLNISLVRIYEPLKYRQYFYWAHIIISSLVASALMIYISRNLIVFPNLSPEKVLGPAFRGFVANLLVNTFLYSANLLSKYKNLEAENEKLRRNEIEIQLSQLKAQLNPHFLFNSLNTLKAMVEEKDRNSVQYLIKLCEVYRYFLENSGTNLVTIGEELKIAHAYFFMLKSRFEDNITMEVRLNPHQLDICIPSMTLQLLIENALKHNVVSKNHPLIIEIFVDDDHLVVRNTLQLKRMTEGSTGIGLSNLNNRYRILLGKELEINNNSQYFEVKIPLK